MQRVFVSGAFDDMRFKDFRFLEEASRLGPLHALLWSDEAVAAATGKPPKFPQAERQYFLESIRFLSGVTIVQQLGDQNALPEIEGPRPDTWAVLDTEDVPLKRAWCRRHGLIYHVVRAAHIAEVAPPPECPANPATNTKKVVVTGCFDWFHSGHVRFFEEVSELGDLYVVVGHDENLRLLKGEGHPLFPAVERRYLAGAIRFVKLALISTGHGWMDAEPEFTRIKADIYAVNEDGDRPEKRKFCEEHGIEYRVLKRLPKEGLPRRQSTALRGY